jgi:pyridine nucleotide-disulfide oxidoreductase family protein
MKRLVLVGGGHAHLSVLEALARERPGDVEVVLVTPSRYQIYSGMLPGWMAGHYGQSQCQIDLHPLAQSARIGMVTDRIAGMDAGRRCVQLPDGRQIDYDLLSLDTGSETDVSSLEMAREKLLPVKPLDKFFEAWPRILLAAGEAPDYRLVVVGGGAAGVELALAARFRLMRSGVASQVDLVAPESGLLPGHAESVKRRVARYLAKVNVVVHRLQGTATQTGIALSDGTLLRADCVIAATGARAPRWLAQCGLQLDETGYIAVDEFYRSLSHNDVFAAGDVSARQDIAVARSGVHAVHAGPVLAANLLAALRGGPLRTYQPRRHSLYLLACGPRYAIASWGRWSAEGAWVWHWKDRIDRGFVRRFARPR